MKAKTQYRSKPQAEIISQPEPQLKPEPIIQADPKTDMPTVEPKTETEYRAEVSKADEAATRLKQQLAELERSSELHRQAAQMAQQHIPLTRDQKLDVWRQQGMPEDQAAFLKANPELIDYSDLAAYAANEAAQKPRARQRGAHEGN